MTKQTTTLIIARHGNTFEAGQTPTRIGCHTDMPLVDKGRLQAVKMGQDFVREGYICDVAYTSFLSRAHETAQIVLDNMGLGNNAVPLHQQDMFNEIDYGPDEDQLEDVVIARIGAAAIEKWNTQAIAPQGWDVDVEAIKQQWLDFGKMICEHHAGQTVLVVTSNGIARFAPILTGDWQGFSAQHDIKLATGAYAVMGHQGNCTNHWDVKAWNIRPNLD